MPALVADPGLLAAELTIVLTMVGLEIAILLWIVPRAGGAPAYARLVLATSALFGSAGLLLAILWTYEYPTLNSATILLLVAGITMGFPPGFWMIAVILCRDQRPSPTGWPWPALVGLLAISGEMLMGYVLSVVEGQQHSPLGWVGAALTSPWYLGSMVIAMAALALWIRFPEAVRAGLIGLGVSGLAGVAIAADPLAAAVATAAAMSATLYAVVRLLPRGDGSAVEARWIRALVAGLALSGACGLAAAVTPSVTDRVLVFGLGTAAIMVAEFLFLVRAGWAATFALGPGVGAPPVPEPGPVPA